MSRNLMENDAPKTFKMVPKSDQNGTTNHPNAGFVRFGGVLEEVFFRRFWGPEKSRPKIWKNQPPGYLLGGPAECAGPLER